MHGKGSHNSTIISGRQLTDIRVMVEIFVFLVINLDNLEI